MSLNRGGRELKEVGLLDELMKLNLAELDFTKPPIKINIEKNVKTKLNK